ncbi:MAG: imidazole glycerol phosphate synthase subunit HisF [Alphaproteobacteria bacterium]|jgi:cyclase|nr:imidazole glycerol phosphate synthase subunit HisF [Alphaproteobacteria bacterium]MCB1551125.1 imidazole glycerol phosphate synthase subunit HisF [Alphaproteobacteria bacterium]MCB9985044.1 imidazole glycerol phosphate synthase subunit HisF [Micavibrio sp.]
MLTKRIVACLDVKDGVVVKGVQFKNHTVMGDIIELAQRYRDEGVDELVFYDITASSDNRVVDKSWVSKVARVLDVPFCVAGGIRTIEDARRILNEGADKLSVNSPALERPEFITELAEIFGVQCVVVGVDSRQEDGEWVVYQYTGDETRTIKSRHAMLEWLDMIQKMGAGEVVLNCMAQDGVRKGYDIAQLKAARDVLKIPLIASGGAGEREHFYDVFQKAGVDGALAASVFHTGHLNIGELKNYLAKQGLSVRQ